MSRDRFPRSLETDRLFIRSAQPGDGELHHRAVHESLAELRPWLPWVQTPPTLESCEEVCRAAHARYLAGEDMMALVFLKASGELIGGSGLHDMNWTLRSCEIGYWGRTGYTGRGLLTEAVRALAEHALRELAANRVFLTTDDANVRSWSLAERAGFEFEGLLRNDRFNVTGQLRDTRVYARVPARRGSGPAATRRSPTG